VEIATFLEFVEGTRKVFAAAKASLITSHSFATRPGREGRQGALNPFGRSQSISQLLNKEDSLSLFLKASDHQRNIHASTYNCSCAISSLRERKRYTRPTHLTTQHIKQKGQGELSAV